MTWLLLLSLALIVFLNRYFFLEPKVAFKLPHWIENMLQYSAPCLLTAICAPIVFFNDQQLRALPLDAYFLTAIICIVLALISKKNLSQSWSKSTVFLWFILLIKLTVSEGKS